MNIIDWAKNIIANKKTNVLWFVSTNKRALNKQSFDFYVVNTKNIKLIGSYKINDFGEKAKSFNNFIDDKYEGKRALYEKDNISLDYGIVAKYEFLPKMTIFRGITSLFRSCQRYYRPISITFYG